MHTKNSHSFLYLQFLTSESQREVHVERDMEEATQDEVEEVRSDLDESSGAICLPLTDSSGLTAGISFKNLLDGIEMIQITVNAIPENGNLALKAVGYGAIQSLQLCRDLWCLNPGREVLESVVTNAANRIRDLFICLDDAVREGGLQFTLHNWPAILNGVPSTQRKNDNRIVRYSSSSRPAPANPAPANPPPANPAPANPPPANPPPANPAPANPPPANPPPANPAPANPPHANPAPANPPSDNPAPDNPALANPPPANPAPANPPPANPAPANPPPANPAPANPAPDNPALANPPLPNRPPPNSTLAKVMAATKQMLNYVRQHKPWIITGAVAGGVVAAAGGAVAGGVIAGGVVAGVVAAAAAGSVGVAGGAVAGLAAKKIKDKYTQPPPHEHQD